MRKKIDIFKKLIAGVLTASMMLSNPAQIISASGIDAQELFTPQEESATNPEVVEDDAEEAVVTGSDWIDADLVIGGDYPAEYANLLNGAGTVLLPPDAGMAVSDKDGTVEADAATAFVQDDTTAATSEAQESSNTTNASDIQENSSAAGYQSQENSSAAGYQSQENSNSAAAYQPQESNTEPNYPQPDYTADAETQPYWESLLPQDLAHVTKPAAGEAVTESDFRNDIVRVAYSQHGYQESWQNFIYEPDGSLSYYTRYGSWYGISCYDKPWDINFVDFVLWYSGIPACAVDLNGLLARIPAYAFNRENEVTSPMNPYDTALADQLALLVNRDPDVAYQAQVNGIPYDNNAALWTYMLASEGRYLPPSHQAEAGDVIFLMEADGTFRTGIVTGYVMEDDPAYNGPVEKLYVVSPTIGEERNYVTGFTLVPNDSRIYAYGIVVDDDIPEEAEQKDAAPYNSEDNKAELGAPVLSLTGDLPLIGDLPEPNYTAPTAAEGLIYNDEAQPLITPGTAEGGTMEYSLSPDADFDISLPTGTEAGSYTVYYKVVGDEEHSDTEVMSLTVDIAPASVFVAADSLTKAYGDSDPSLTATVTGLFGDDTIAYSLTRAEGESIGEYTITAEGEAVQGSYNITYSPATFTINPRPVTVSADDLSKTYGDADPELTATVTGLLDGDTIDYTLSRAEGENAGTYTITPTGEAEQGSYSVTFEDGSLTISPIPVTLTAVSGTRNYDGKEKSISGFTASVDGLTFNGVSASGRGTAEGTYDVTFTGATPGRTTDTTGNYVIAETIPGTLRIETLLTKELVTLEGSWASYRVSVNPNASTLNENEALTLADTFTSNQSIDYASITLTGQATYDYRGTTGTFVIPDATPVTITYRTRIIAQPGEVVDFGNTATLKDSAENVIGECTIEETQVIYPSANDVAGTSGIYMLKLYVYGDASMQTGIEGAEFVLLDANRRPMTYKKGAHAGETIAFTTDSTGWVDIALDEEECGVSIQKNTAYYLEMVRDPEGYKRDSTLYNFMITDDPSYNSGGVWTYYNGDTIKVRLYPEDSSLNVSVRFSGNYPLNEEQQNGVEVILQKLDGSAWTEVERHAYSEFTNGTMTFDHGISTPFDLDSVYRIVQENQRPWDIDATIIVRSTYIYITSSAEPQSASEPIEFSVTQESLGKSINVVINNEYEEPRLLLTKMDKETGALLSGAVFTVKKASDDSVIKSYTTDADGIVDIVGGSDFESETLYYVVETQAPEHYLMPLAPEKIYFYFCNDSFLIPSILSGLPEGETAVNLSETYESLTIDNQKEKRTIPVMKTWQGNTWPSNVREVEIGLYESVGGAEPSAVLDEHGDPLTVTLTKAASYNNRAFVDLPARDASDQTITYSIKEEHVYNNGGYDIVSDYVQEYGVSDAGVYIVRNKEATTLTVNKEWYDIAGEKITDDAVLADQSSVTFDIYRASGPVSEALLEDGFTNEEMSSFAESAVKVRSNVTFGQADDWTIAISDLAKKDDLGNVYYYYVMETVPSFGDEIYVPDGENGVITIQNQIAPEMVKLTVTKAALVEDPRPESVNTDFIFTLALNLGDHVIRSYTVNETNALATDWNGEVTFSLKPTQSIELTVPAGVTATVTEAVNREYVVKTECTDTTDLETETGRIFRYETAEGEDVSLTFINTLRVICKVVDPDGEPHPFESFKSALAYIRENEDIYHGTAVIEMLEDYEMTEKDVFDVQSDENITLTTADVNATDRFPFVTDREENADRAVITRSGEGGSMLTNEGVLTLEKVCLDGAKAEYMASGDGGIIHTTGTLNLNNQAELRNAKASGRGGAIYAEGTVNMAAGSAITGNAAPSASAIYLAAGTMNITGGTISGNSGTADGALVVNNTECRIYLSGAPVIYDNTNTTAHEANLYLGVDSDNVINVIAPGLDAEAKIGVWAMESHREIGEQFANTEYEVTNNLNCFVNDLYEYRGKVKEGTSTNVVWDGLTLTLVKAMDPSGANANDTFTITVSSTSLRKSSYTIDGTVDYTVTAARQNVPGRIVINNVRAGDAIDISPLPVGTYTVTEAASNYTPAFTGENTEIGSTFTITDGSFTLEGNSTVTVTNTRREADLVLTKSLQDKLVGDEAVSFSFTIGLSDEDGTKLSGFALADGLTTNANGQATLTLSPTNTVPAGKALKAPVGSIVTITEASDVNYRVEASAVTMPAEGEGTEIEDTDTGRDNVFIFKMTDEGADVSVLNVRKMADIELRKDLAGKVSAEETFDFTVEMKRANGDPATDYVLYEDPENPENNIVTDANGRADISMAFGRNETSHSVILTVPEGTRLTVTEAAVTKDVNGTQREIYNTTYSINGGASATGKTALFASVVDTDSSLVFTNSRKMQTITVTNTVGGYSGNVVPFTFTATVTDGGEDDYDENGFTDGVQTFELATGQSRTLTVPYGATLSVEESFIVGYDTTVKRGSAAAVTATGAEFVVTGNETLAFTNNQLIAIVLVNHTSNDIENIQIYTAYGTKMFRVNAAGDGQTAVTVNNHWASVSIASGETAILEVNHGNTAEYAQAYTVRGTMPADGYYYTINNEPSYHEYADPAVMRVYNASAFEVKGQLRYSTSDSTVTFTEQPLVSFDVNGGAWTTEMEGYHDRDGDRQVYQYAVTAKESVPVPTEPVYPTDEGIEFLGWTANAEFAAAGHTAADRDSDKMYDFAAAVNEPLTLYAVWNKDRDTHTVTVKNGTNGTLNFTIELTRNGQALGNYAIADGLRTDASGRVTFALAENATKNLTVPEGARFVARVSETSLAFSSEFEDADNVNNRFTITSVARDGTVTFTSGICKITDAGGNILYNNNGQPCVYATLQDAFTAYVQNLYSDANCQNRAVPAYVKMLVDEYAITAKHPFPSKDMILTTAGKDDADFPYTGTRDRSTLYRADSFRNDCLFTLEKSARKVTLTDIIIDGKNVPVANNVNGSFIYCEYAGTELVIDQGTIMRNVVYSSYSSGAYGGAIYVKNNTLLTINAGIFSNLQAKRGGAICVSGSGTLHVYGRDGSTRFENCSTGANNGEDGGAVYYTAANPLVIDGGSDKDNPGVVFNGCQAQTGGNNGGDGGAIFANTAYNHTVSVRGCSFTECSAKVNNSNSTGGNGGGAIAAYHVKGLDVSSCVFNACDTMTGGGAIVAYVKTATEENRAISISDCEFDSCNCRAQGGAVAAYQDNNNATGSRTVLAISDSSFTNCSSGTGNGSGGAIQCYLPCLDFNGTTFMDCWAGKEGGAVNNWYGANNSEMWANAYMNVIGCSFIRCRAEDRYDLTGIVHYGGGIATKTRILLVQDSYFEDCVSTLKQGGAVHCSGIGDGSRVTVENSTFKNCLAKDNGGAFMASNETMVVTGSNFYGCSSFAANGGAIYHGNSRNSMNQSVTNISDCTFSADPEGSGAESCSAAGNGGAIWTRSRNVSIADCAIDDCTAAGKGGAVYFSYNSNAPQNARISSSESGESAKGVITGCEAADGSAVFAENNSKVTFSGAVITDNTVSNKTSAAVHAGGDGSIFYFEGNVKVEENHCSNDAAYDHDVLMHRNNSNDNNMTIVQTTTNGLGMDAHIGIYVPDNIFDRRGTEGKVFGKHASGIGAEYLDCFFNDRDDQLFGYKASTDNSLIYWGIIVCKITDAEGNTLKRANGRDAVYQRLTMALDDFTRVTGGEPVYIKMLVEDYYIKQKETITNFPAANVTLTTELESDPEQEKYYYRGTPGTVCTISRDTTYSENKQLFSVSDAGTTFALENITLDGRKNKTASEGVLRLIYLSAGSLIIKEGSTLQFGKAETGGAVWADKNSSMLINGSYDDAKQEPSVKFISCNSSGDKNGGAIAANSLTVTCEGYEDEKFGTAFIDCTAARGGAIVVTGAALDITGALFSNCHCNREGGAIYHNNNNNNSNTVTKIEACAFENCYTGEPYVNGSTGNNWSFGGAVVSQAMNLEVNRSSFENCYSLSSGGAICHTRRTDNAGNINERTGTTITNSSFNNCRTYGTGNDYNNYSYGGSVFSAARAVELSGCTVSGSTASNNGGALYTWSSSNGSVVTISGTSFTDCQTEKNNGLGGAVYASAKTVTVKDQEGNASTFESCMANGQSGAIYLVTDGSTLNITDTTKISSCYAKEGGAIYLKSGVTMNLTGSPEFTNNGYIGKGSAVMNAEKGACIYLASGSRINLSGSPKFSRNIITNVDRVTNGGITDYVRQDIYLANYAGTKATSIHVAGELTGDTIWVWPENSPHRLAGEQFATKETDISAASLDKFRNALSDSDTGCSNGEYLAGVIGVDETCVYWDKMYTVSFRKIDNKAVAVAGAQFTLYSDAACTEVVGTSVSANGETDTNAQGDLLSKGMVEFPSVSIGVYYMKETVVPTSFHENDITYIILVGTPSLAPNANNREIWENGGPLDVPNAATLVARYTTNTGRYYGIYPLGTDGKATLTRNLASANAGIVNIRNDHEAYFMKVDGDGAALPNAEFTIYTQVLDTQGQPRTYDNGYPVLTLWSRDGENYPEPVKSADGSAANKRLDGTTVPKGLVYFRELPIGTFYLLESAYPERNGSNRKTFYVESDRVFELTVNGDEDFVLKEMQDDGTYETCPKVDNYYTVSNEEAVCKLTDASNNLLYKLGRDGTTLIPAVYPSLEAGFNAAQNSELVNASGSVVASDSMNPALKLKALKDLTVTSPIEFNSSRAVTLTTAERNATAADKFVFSTTRTSDTSRAEILRGYSEDTSENANSGGLITISNGAALTLQNIGFNGQKASYNGRAIHVTEGSLTILSETRIQNFKQEAPADSTDENDVRGGAILVDDGNTITIDGGAAARSAVFSNNEVRNRRTDGSTLAEGGAIAAGNSCTVNISNAQFTGNSATASAENAGRGGAVMIAESGGLSLRDAVIRYNNAAEGSAVYAAEAAVVTVNGGNITGNTASGQTGGAINVGGANTRIYFTGSPRVTDNYNTGRTQQRNVVLSEDTNEIIRTSEQGLTGGRIGVYVIDGTDDALYTAHGLSGKPFGTFASSRNLNIFKNDRNAALYGVRNEKDNGDVLIYWVTLGGSVAFKKIDSFGNPVDGAIFTLYTDAACTTAFENEPGVSTTAVSADGSSTKNQDGNVLAKGTVLFEEIPDGIYYMKETTAPDGFIANTFSYIVLVGEDVVKVPAQRSEAPWNTILADISQSAVTGQVERYLADKASYKIEEDSRYAIFRIDTTSGKAETVPDISGIGVMNIPVNDRKAILRKIDDGYTSLEGAVFEILHYDLTKVSGKDAAGNTTTSFTSLSDGVYYIDKMPFGTYYVHETGYPEGVSHNPSDTNESIKGWWYTLTVSAEGITSSAQSASEPWMAGSGQQNTP